jgi:predicted Zn-dependent protease
MHHTLITLLAAAALAAGCTTVTNPVTGRAERTVMDEATEVAEGKKAHEQVLAEYGVYSNPRLQAYVAALGQKLAAQSHRSQLQWTFTVLDSPEVNAFALPGGYIYVTRGILAHLDSEADLAGVIGHEIGHVTARHGAQRATRAQAAGVGVIAAVVLGAVLEGAGVRGATDVAGQLGQGVAAGYIARYSRDQELQADRLGAEYLSRSGYSPRHMIDVIGALKDLESFAADSARAQGRAAPARTNWLSSHPSNDQRLQEIRSAAAQYTGSYVEEGRARYLQAIDGIGYGDSREQGVVRGNRFYHEPLGVTVAAPPRWAIDNARDAITIANPAGDAGLVIKLVPKEAGSTHEQILRNAFKPTQGRSERYQVNGLAATHFSGQRSSSQGGVQPLVVTLISGPGGNEYALIYAARDAQTLQRAAASLREVEASFSELNAQDRAAARPWALKSVRLPAGGLPELARRAPVTDAERVLRLINGVYAGGGPLQSGQLVKTIE